jgi:hypothetical protein
MNPVIIPQPKTKLSEVKSITIKSPFSEDRNDASDIQAKKKTISLTAKTKDIISQLLSDTQRLSDIDVSQIVSAELILNISKPKKMSDSEYQNIYGAMLKPIADLENVTFKDKNGNKIKGSEIPRTKQVNIDTTEKGAISEPDLNREMVKFLNELRI